MLEKSKVIVLNTVKYGDNSLIANCYSERFGRIAFIVGGAHAKKKSAGKAVFFLPLALLDLVFYRKESGSLSRIKEISLSGSFDSIHFEPHKQAISLFIAELLLRTIREAEPNETLFRFLETAICLLDVMQQGEENFHLIFMLQLSRFLGFFPGNSWSRGLPYFDYKNGLYTDSKPSHGFFLDRDDSRLIGLIQQTPFHRADSLLINRIQRNRAVEGLLLFFRFHLDMPMELNSLPVLTQLFD